VPTDERAPCPNCGSLARRFEVEVWFDVQPTLSVLPGVTPQAFDGLAAAIRERNPDLVRTLCLTDLSGGTFMSEVLDEDGESLASGLGDHEDDAILELADHLKRG